MKNWEFAFTGNWPAATVLAVGALAIALGYLFYRSQRPQLRGLRFPLLCALRALAIAVAALFLLKPEIRFSRTEVEQTQVLVLQDVSESMGIRDATEGRSRLEAGLQVLKEAPYSLLERLSKVQTVRHFSFGAYTAELTPGKALRAEQKATAIGEALKEAVSRVGQLKLSGIVLLSDGVNTTGEDPGRVASVLGVPVFPVALGGKIGEQGKFHDVGIASTPRNLEFIVNNKATVRVRVSNFGLQNFTESERLLALSLREGDKPLADKPIPFPALNGTREVEIEYVPKELGIHRLTLSLPVLPGETVTENNARTFTVRVTDPKIRVLIVEGVVRTEYRFLRRTLESDPNVDLTSVVKLQKEQFLLQGVQPGIDLSRGLPAAREDFKKFDVVILGDIGREEFTDLQLEHLKGFVGDGGGLLVLGGYHAFGPGGYAGSPLADVLPVRISGKGDGQIETSFAPRLTEAGQGHPVLEGCAAFFAPGAQQALLDGANKVAGVKPGATVLLVHPTERCGADPMPVAAEQRYGGGRVLAVTADTTWKWKFQIEARGLESPYYRFWRQSMRWLAERKPEDFQGQDLVAAWPGKSEYQPEEMVLMTAKVRDRARQPKDDATVQAEVLYPVPVPRISPEGQKHLEEKAVLELARIPLGLGEYQASFRPPAGGIYRAAVRASDRQGPLGQAEFEFVVGQAVGEFDRVDVDEPALRALASATGGEYHTMATAARIPDLIQKNIRRRTYPEERTLWNTPGFFLVFLGCVVLEWVLRKRYGLN